MILLANSLTTPAVGTLFWSALIFLIVFPDPDKICLETYSFGCESSVMR